MEPLNIVAGRFFKNIDYSVTGDLASAKIFLSAALELQIRRPEETTIDGQQVKFDIKAIQTQITRAERWIAERDTSANSRPNSGARYYDQSNIRGY